MLARCCGYPPLKACRFKYRSSVRARATAAWRLTSRRISAQCASKRGSKLDSDHLARRSTEKEFAPRHVTVCPHHQ